jgi:sugar phosphate isomerase/epimerase
VYVSSNSFRARSLGAVLAACDQAGITGLELSAVEDWDEVLLQNGGSRRYLVHNYCPPPVKPFVLNLASPDSEVLEQSLAHCREAIDLSARLGGPVYAAHAGFAIDLDPHMLGRPLAQAEAIAKASPDAEMVYGRLVASVKLLTVYAKARNVRFLIENHALSELGGTAGHRLLPMVTSGEMVRLTKDIDDEAFGVLVDVGHLNVSAHALGFDRSGFIEALLPSIGGFHLSDNSGIEDEHRSFGDTAWFLPFLRSCPDIPITIELDRAPIHDILKTRDAVLNSL